MMEASYLASLVQESLALYMYENARFLCERLMAAAPTEQNAFLLATCYKHCNQTYRAYRLLRGCQSSPSRYLYAVCCIELGKFKEAEDALLKFGEQQVPNGAAGFYLLGRLCRLNGGRAPDAARHFVRALRLNPLLWSAYEELCTLGEDQAAAEFSQVASSSPQGHPPPPNPFNFSFPSVQTPSDMDITPPTAQLPHGRPPNSITPIFQSTTTHAGAAPVKLKGQGAGLFDNPAQLLPLPSTPLWPSSSPAAPPSTLPPSPHWPSPSPAAPPSNFITPSPTSTAPIPPLPKKGDYAAGTAVAFPGFTAGSSAPAKTPHMGQRQKVMDEGKLRKVSGRLFSEPGSVRRSPRIAAGGSGSPASQRQASQQSQSTVVGAAGPSTASTSAGSEPTTTPFCFTALPESPAHQQGAHRGAEGQLDDEEAEAAGLAEAQAAVLALLAPLLEGFRHLCMFRCQEALECFKLLPQQQYNTGWVLCQVGRAHTEMVDYPAAASAFETARKCDPFRVEGMEVYSTVLWHLKKEVELSHLAMEMKDIDRLAPHTWCVLGNCFSLQREHEAALQLFQRSIQLAPAFPYAYTLAAHEYFANEDFDKALSFYRHAIRHDPRHYNALYGIGQIHFRQEQYKEARTQFMLALEINPVSSVLKCYLGMACHKLHYFAEALDALQDAIDTDPKNPLARFEKAAVLVSLERYHDALQELQRLQEVVPKEASVHFQMGKLYKRTGQLDRALQHLNLAMVLQPASSDVGLIKSAIEKIQLADDHEDDDL